MTSLLAVESSVQDFFLIMEAGRHAIHLGSVKGQCLNSVLCPERVLKSLFVGVLG